MSQIVEHPKTSHRLGSVLVVDDDPSTRSVIRIMISKLPIQMWEAADGQTALEIVKTQNIDVIVSDLVMPNMSGLMFLHVLIERGIQIPFILLTGFSDKDSAIQALRLGVFDYLEKPVHEDDLKSVLEEALRVSQDQKMILAGQGLEGKTSVHSVDPRAKTMILKMRVFGSKEQKIKVVKDDDASWSSLRDLFAAEAMELLRISQQILTNWIEKKQSLIDLGYILRVVQSIRFAANSICLAQVADTAWHCEAAIAAIKLVPEHISPKNVKMIARGVNLLFEQIGLLIKLEDSQTIKDLDHLQLQLNKAS
jgi:CheY-like chemotaxis protein